MSKYLMIFLFCIVNVCFGVNTSVITTFRNHEVFLKLDQYHPKMKAHATQNESDFLYDLVVCTIFKDDAPYIQEWVELHRAVGVQHFYLCSHNSSDNYLKALQPYIKEGIVDLIELKDDPNTSSMDFILNVQCVFYDECIRKMRRKVKWVALIDSDEFLFPSDGQSSLPDILKEFENESCGAVGVNWQMFGTSNVSRVPENELLSLHLVRCAEKDDSGNFFVKSIVRPERVFMMRNPHFANLRTGFQQVNTDHVAFTGDRSPYVQVDKLRINHYWTRDEYYFNTFKVPRQKLWWQHSDGYLKDALLKMNLCEDKSIFPYLDKVKQSLESKNK